MEDYVSVMVLRLLGYRWPNQDMHEREHGPLLAPDLVAPDGIIPLVRWSDAPTLLERIRDTMERQLGEEGAHRTELEFRKWVGRDLDTWLERDFFRQHIDQFKRRPIAWHLTSSEGTLQTLALYHRLSREALQRIQNIHAAGLVNRLRGEHERSQSRRDTRTADDIQAQIEDVEDFRTRVRAIEEGRDLLTRIRCPWKGEEEHGRPGPYAPDMDDGVKVNIRPFQEAGLLARDVIKKW